MKPTENDVKLAQAFMDECDHEGLCGATAVDRLAGILAKRREQVMEVSLEQAAQACERCTSDWAAEGRRVAILCAANIRATAKRLKEAP